MQKKSRNYLIGSAIFIFLMFLSLFFSRPIYKKLENKINSATEHLSSTLLQNTGLKVKYKSLSPSILTSFLIYGIQIFDQNDNLLLQINKTKVTYNLRNVFSKNVQKIVKNVILDGANCYISAFLDYANAAFPQNQDEKFDIQKSLEMVEAFLPSSFSMKNLNFNYTDSNMDLTGNMRKASLLYSEKDEIFYFYADTDLNLSAQAAGQKFSGNFSIDSQLFPHNQIDDSSILLKISQITDGNLCLNKINLQFDYAKNHLTAKTLENTFPLNLNLDYDLENQDAKLNFSSNMFYPNQIISASDNNENNQTKKIYDLVKDIGLLVSGDVEYNLNTSRFVYNSSGNVILPESLVSGGMNVEYSVFGNDKKINVSTLNLKNDNLSFNADFSYIFKTMQLSGIAEIPYLKLPNGNELSTEIYFDQKEKGFMAFSPQVFIGDNALTALQIDVSSLKDSVDFTLEVSDYSHIEESEPGVLNVYGSYLFDSKYLQTSLSLNTIYVDSLASVAASVLDEETSGKIQKFLPDLKPYVISTDAYCSTNFSSLSFNIPYILLADTTKENVALMLSANGNEQSIQLNQLNLIYGKQMFTASASLDRMPDSSDMFVVLDFNNGSIPYHLSGSIMPEIINFSGSYGADIQVNMSQNNINGHVIFDNLPAKIDKATLALSLDADFDYTQEFGPEIQISRFAMEETGTLFSSNPKLNVIGNITKYGAQFNSITFSDSFSTLEGSSDINLNVQNKVFDSAGLRFDLKNPLSSENVSADITVSTPTGGIADGSSLLDSLYIDSQILFSNFSLNRFMSTKNDNNELTMALFMTGPVNHPYVSLNIDKLNLFIGGQLASAKGLAFVEDRDISVNDFSVDYAGFKFDDILAQFSLETMTGALDSSINYGPDGKSIKIPFHIAITDSVVKNGAFFPDEFNAALTVSNSSGDLIKKSFDFTVNMMYLNKNISFYSSDNLGLYGSFDTSGDVFAKFEAEKFTKGEIKGTVLKDDINVKLSNFEIDLKELLSYFNFDNLIRFYDGKLQGSVTYKQTGSDPEFKGAMAISNSSFDLPMIIPDEITSEKLRILFDGNVISVPESVFYIKNKHRFGVSSRIFMNNWLLDHAEASVSTIENDLIPISYSNSLFSLGGDVRCNIKADFEDNSINLDGYTFVENMLAKSSISEVTQKTDQKENKTEQNPLDIHANLILQLGTHAMVNFDPLLRCIFVPNTTVGVVADVEDNYYDISGSMKIKSGDISYLNRNFYIKEGSVTFNSDNFSNPVVTIRAETREKDDHGDNVRIILSAENQLLSDFNPKFSSIPSKSETEIQTILGQIAIGDTQNGTDLALMAGDYALQSMVFRNVENKLRNALNIDIFSVRTNIIQNATASAKAKSTSNGFGTVFDNSSIYVGRYFGDMFYFDAMLNYSYKENNDFLSGILPEIGVELELPFLNFLDSSTFNATSTLRWSMMPDIEAMRTNKEYIPASSVTLSWKFSF